MRSRSENTQRQKGATSGTLIPTRPCGLLLLLFWEVERLALRVWQKLPLGQTWIRFIIAIQQTCVRWGGGIKIDEIPYGKLYG